MEVDAQREDGISFDRGGKFSLKGSLSTLFFKKKHRLNSDLKQCFSYRYVGLKFVALLHPIHATIPSPVSFARQALHLQESKLMPW